MGAVVTVQLPVLQRPGGDRMRPPQDDIKRLCAWRKRVNRGVYHDKEVSDAAKAAFRRAAYQTERKEREDGEKDGQK